MMPGRRVGTGRNRPSRSTALLAALLAAALAGRAQAEPAPARSASDTLGVLECAALARLQAPAVRAATLGARSAALDSAAAGLNRRPEVALNAGAWLAPDGAYDPAFTNLGEYHAQLGAVWTLADGGRRLRARDRAGLDLASARVRRSLVTRDAGLDAAALALRCLRLREQAEALADAADGLDRIGALVGAGVRSGLRSPADTIRLGLAREDAALDLDAARAEGESTRLELLDAIGRDLSRDVVVRAEPPVKAEAPTAADSLALVARVAGRAEVALLETEEAGARLDALEAEHRGSPEIGFTLDAGLSGTDLAHAVPPSLLDAQPDATFSSRLRRDLGASAAITFRLPLFDAARAPALAARRAALEAAHLRTLAEARRQEREALVLFSRWRSAAGRARATGSIIGRAESHFLRTKSLYAAGATTLFDVLDALQLLKDARLRRAEAGEDLRMVRFQIEDRR
jgi:outer membrane protein TolC